MLAGLRVVFAAFDPFPNHKGSGTRIAREVSALARAGVEVTLVTLAGRGRAELPNGVRHLPVRLLEDNYLARALAFRQAVHRHLLHLRPDRVHARGPFEAEAALEFGIPLLFEVNGLPSVELRYHHPQVGTDRAFLGRLVELERRVLRGAEAWLTQSQTTARFLRRVAQMDRDAYVIPNGAELERYAEARHEGDEVRLIYAGAISPWQGLGLVLPALRDLKHDPRWQLDVVGGGRKAWQAQLKDALRGLGLGGRVRLLGSASRSEVAAALAASHVGLCPLRRDLRNRLQGCSPIKAFEYGAAGLAVLASNLPCNREIYGAEEAAWAFPKRSQFRECLARLLDAPEERRRLGTAARQAVVERHQWSRRDAALVKSYEAWAAARASA